MGLSSTDRISKCATTRQIPPFSPTVAVRHTLPYYAFKLRCYNCGCLKHKVTEMKMNWYGQEIIPRTKNYRLKNRRGELRSFPPTSKYRNIRVNTKVYFNYAFPTIRYVYVLGKNNPRKKTVGKKGREKKRPKIPQVRFMPKFLHLASIRVS